MGVSACCFPLCTAFVGPTHSDNGVDITEVSGVLAVVPVVGSSSKAIPILEYKPATVAYVRGGWYPPVARPHARRCARRAGGVKPFLSRSGCSVLGAPPPACIIFAVIDKAGDDALTGVAELINAVPLRLPGFLFPEFRRSCDLQCHRTPPELLLRVSQRSTSAAESALAAHPENQPSLTAAK